MEKKSEKGKENAYFSLEACLILPLVFYVLIFLIYVGFYQYNQCLLHQDIYRFLIRGNQVRFMDNYGVAEKLKEEEATWYYEKYMLCSWGSKTIEVEHGSIRLAQAGVLRVPFSVLTEWTGKPEWKFSVDAKGCRVRPTETIRNCRRLETVVERKNEYGGLGICEDYESELFTD